jgi:protein involved in polysaccharide export with SLBB domain
MKKSIFILVVFAFSVYSVFSQTKGFLPSDQDKILQESMQSNQAAEKLINGENSVIGDVVEPDYYFPGPGDVISYLNISASSNMQMLMVSPELTVSIPRIGELSIKGMNLSQVKFAIEQKVKTIQQNALISVGLYKPRKVFIKISGAQYSGVYSLPSTYRVSTALKAISRIETESEKQPSLLYMNALKSDKIKSVEEKINPAGFGLKMDYSSRNITLLDKNSNSRNIDIEKAKATANIELDPYIRENDEIIIPYDDPNAPIIAMSGALNRPCRIPWRNGDKASELIKMAGGLSTKADLQNIKVFSPSGSEQSINVGADGIVASDFEVEAGAGICVGFKNIASSENENKVGFVSVKGEVNNPGVYPINSKTTKLKDIIQMAGGLKNTAYLPLANIIRVSEIDKNSKLSNEYFQFFQGSDLTMEDSTRTRYILENKPPVVSCSFSDLYVNNSDKDNVSLQDGDVINIPKNPGTVYIFGYVNRPGYVKFEPGKNLNYYIEQAGGFSKGAAKSRSRIVRGANMSWTEGDEDVFVYAGDKVYVPAKPDLPPGTEIQYYSVLISSITALISIVYLIQSLVKKN